MIKHQTNNYKNYTQYGHSTFPCGFSDDNSNFLSIDLSSNDVSSNDWISDFSDDNSEDNSGFFS